jgi:hypothetical protein
MTQVDQDLDWVPGGAEPGDSFGESIATVDYAQDGYTGLVVSTLGEDIGDSADAGMVDVFLGSGDGLGIGIGAQGNKRFEQGRARAPSRNRPPRPVTAWVTPWPPAPPPRVAYGS